MTSITTRAGKGSPLTHNEVDANFTNLNNDKLDTAGIALGSAASPTLKFTGDANTGIYSPGADQLAVATNGVGRLFVDASGNAGIGTSSPAAKLQVATGTNDYTNVANTFGVVGPNSTGFYIGTHYDGSGAGCDLVSRGYSTTLGDFRFIALNGSYASPTERMRIDSSGRVGIGTSSPATVLEVVSSTDDDHLTLYKTGVVGGAGPGIKFSNQNNTGTRVHLAGIRNEITSGTVGAEGGALVFTTKDNGDASPQERLYVSSSGNVGIGTTSPTTLLDVNADTARVRTARTPASAAATGATGEICWDASYIYVCTATNTWKRSALSTW